MVTQATGLAVGLNKGHQVTKREKAPKAANRKGVSRRWALEAQISWLGDGMWCCRKLHIS